MIPLFITLKDVFNAFPEALAAGLIIAAACSFLGVFVVLKRVIFISATLSQVAACGIAIALYCHFPPFSGAMILTLFTVTVLAYPLGEERIPKDALMGAIFVLASGLGVLIVSKSGFGIEEVKSLLYGDLILTSHKDLEIILLTVLPVIGLFSLFSRPIIYTFIDREEAKILGICVILWELFFFYTIGMVISASSRIGGMLLVFCYMVVPPTTALLLSNRLVIAIAISVTIAVCSTISGFCVSFIYDLPANQVITVISCLLLAASICSRFFGFTSLLSHPHGRMD